MFRGNKRAFHKLEQFLDEVAHEQETPIFCSFLMDNYDPAIYDEVFKNVCGTHSNVIPVRDYVAHRAAVNFAVDEVVGQIRGDLLLSLIEWTAKNDYRMPSSQTLLLWVQETMPAKFAAVLEMSKFQETQKTEGKSA